MNAAPSSTGTPLMVLFMRPKICTHGSELKVARGDRQWQLCSIVRKAQLQFSTAAGTAMACT